jgi:hypothetical protein
MTAKWVKAAFLGLLGIVILYYADGVLSDLESNISEEWNMSFEWTWDLLRYLLWIFIAWLFVDAALIVALSFRMETHSITDVMEKLSGIEERITSLESTLVKDDSEEVEGFDDEPAEVEEEGTPPPPGE